MFPELIGKSFASVVGMEEGGEDVVFKTDDGCEYKMYHEQDCCESVFINDICGDVSDLIGSKIVHFEERSSFDCEDIEDESVESFTWTFYDIQTEKGCVNIRWFGESNGYYSEDVSFEKIG